MALDTFNVLGRYQVEIPEGEEGGAEISAYDPGSQNLFVVNAFANAIDILNLADPTNPVLAVINDNDFGLLDEEIPIDGSVPFNPDPIQTVLGIIEFDPLVLDASDEDGGINLQNYPIFGLFQPDAVASYQVNGATFYVTANEGDARDEDVRIADITLDSTGYYLY